MKKEYMTYIGSFILALLLSSCKIGKEYVRPGLDLPPSMQQTVLSDSASVSELKWWELYTDTTLQDLINKALEYNKDILIAAARIKETSESQHIAKAALFPKIDLKAAGQREYDRSPENTFEGKGLLSWEVDLWGKLRWGNQAAIANYLGTVEGKKALQMTIIAQVAQTYFELSALDEELRIVKQTWEARKESVRLTQLRFEGGITSETSLRQAEVELARTATLLPDLERRIKLKENDISLLTGHYPGMIKRGESIRGQKMPGILPVGLPSALLQRRPDIRQAEYALKMAHAKVGIAYTSMFPKLTLTGHYGAESPALKEFLRSPYFFIGGELMAPLFNMGKNRANLKAEKARMQQQTYTYQKAVLTAFKEVNDALITAQKIEEIKQSRINLEKAAASYKELANLQYLNGIIGYIDVLDAQRGYFDAQVGLNNAIRDQLIATVNLYKVLGGGWE